jgi:hypothetical protein
MEMIDGLTAIGPSVHYQPVAVRLKSLGFRHIGGQMMQPPDKRFVLPNCFGEIDEMVPGHDQDVNRSLRVDIANRNRVGSLPDHRCRNLTGDDAAEQTTARHVLLLSDGLGHGANLG